MPYYSFEGRIIGNYPIIEIPLEEQQSFIELANKMIKLNKELQIVKTPQEEKLIKIQIEKVDEQINNEVYELYGLSEEEISIIEDSLNL